MYEEQLKRIKTKFGQARKVDGSFKVFGAKSHKYNLGKCASISEIDAFEKKYTIELPQCYKAFLLNVGNGGSSYAGSAAGPAYGIYPLGQSLNEIVDTPEDSLNWPAIIRPRMSDEEWDKLQGKLDDDNLSDKAYDEEMGRLYAGIMPLGSQGCTYLHALVVTGEYAGRVLNMDVAGEKPRYCFEKNFLDWYERWLDEIISGILLADGPSWFGYTMSGNAEVLLVVYETEAELELKYEALSSMSKLLSADEASCDKLLDICSDTDKKSAHKALQLLTKFSYSKAATMLTNMIDGDDKDCLVACQAIHWYQRQHAGDWLEQLRNRLKHVDNQETFRFITYLIEECNVDYGLDLVPFFEHNNDAIKIHSFYLLGKLKNKRNYLNEFIKGLSDDSSRVVHATLQALNGVKDSSLLKEYYKVSQRYPKEKDYVLVNLEHRLKQYGFSSRSDFVNRYNSESGNVANQSGWFAAVIRYFFNSKR